jgi:tetratricopeptide (TPR) repeat protein/tRNA A-37 threonylcarbamoyl transferase component Bud32
MAPPIHTREPADELGDATEAVFETRTTSPVRRPTMGVPGAGERIAHFQILGTLGRGGMGVVLRARDELLDRVVALKLVRPELTAHADQTRGTEQLLAEARATAKITHPNVITVHEVGVVADQVFLAMEFVAGRTLGEWLVERPRTWQEIVDIWILAGRGLQAAHEADLVHRDFKPANVLVGHDDRVLVTDFGIAGRTQELELAPTDTTATQSGLLGTPRYMAPEQFSGERVSARSDQFAFCVSLWEALYDQHPFDATNFASLALDIGKGHVRDPPRDRGAPDRLRRILLRGLARRPEDRHADLAALVEELTKLRRRVERRRWWIAAGLAVPALTIAIWQAWPEPVAAIDPCAPPTEGWWSGVWDPEVRAELEPVFGSAELPYVRASWPRLHTALDAYTSEWDRQQLRACRDTRVSNTVSEQMLDRRTACLDGARRRVAALVQLLGQGDPEVLAQGLELANRLPSLETCSDLARLEAGVAPPPEALRDQLDAFEQTLAEAQTLDLAGRYEAAQALLEPWLATLEPLDHPIAEARLQLELGASWIMRDTKRSTEHFETAYMLAIAADATELASSAAMQIAIWTPGSADATRKPFWLDVAEAGYRQLGREPDFELHSSQVKLARENHDYPTAREAGEQMLVAAERSGNPHDIIVAEGLLGSVHGESREFELGRRHTQRAFELATTTYGPEHRNTLKWQANLVAIDALAGKDFPGVVERGEALLAAQEAGLGPEHPDVAVTLSVIALALRQLDHVERARDFDARALAIREKVFGAEHRMTIESLEKLARDEVILDQFDPGIAKLRQVIDARAKLHGPEHHDVGRSWSDLGWALGEAGQWREAIEAQRQSLAILGKTLTEPNRQAMTAREQLGRALIEVGEVEAAIDQLERAREQLDPTSADPRTRANVLYQLSRARKLDRPRDREAWREPAQTGLAQLDAIGDREAPVYPRLVELLADGP